MFSDASVAKGVRCFLDAVTQTRDHRLYVILTALAAIFSPGVLLSLLLGFASGHILYTAELPLLYLLALLVGGLVTLGLVLQLASQHYGAKINSQVCTRLVLRGYQQLFNATPQAFAQRHWTQWSSYLTDNMVSLQRQQLFILHHALSSLITACIALLILLLVHPGFLIPVLALLIFTSIVPIMLSSRAQAYINQEAEQMARVNDSSLSLLRGREVLGGNISHAIDTVFSPVLKAMLLNQGQKWIRWNGAFNVKTSLNLFCYLLVLMIGGFLYLQQSLSLSQLLLTYMLVTMLTPKLDNVYKSYNYLQGISGYYLALSIIDDLAVTPDKSTTCVHHIRQLRLTEKHPVSGADTPMLNMSPGQTVLLDGASGEGKSTLLRHVAGIEQSRPWQLWVNGDCLDTAQSVDLWQHLAYQPQQQWLLEHLSATDNLMLTGQPICPHRLNRAINLLELEPLLLQPVSSLSGGEKQRLCFVRCYLI